MMEKEMSNDQRKSIIEELKAPVEKRCGKYNHKEAFCLMLYRCEDCKAIEVIWNSRDGVTPFVASCRICKGAAQHSDWHLDVCMPDYEPYDGQRIFRDITKKEARDFAMKRIQSFEGTEYEVSPERLADVMIDLVESTYHNGEAPCTRVWSDLTKEGQKPG